MQKHESLISSKLTLTISGLPFIRRRKVVMYLEEGKHATNKTLSAKNGGQPSRGEGTLAAKRLNA